MRGFGIAMACALGALGASWACVVQPDLSIICGDGFVDELAGEECDPEDPDSFADACLEIDPLGQPGCDPTTCEIDRTACVLPSCGDGIVNTDQEECEPRDPDGLSDNRFCDADLESPYENRSYTSGRVWRCDPDTCLWDRSDCGYCGNGQIEGEGILAGPNQPLRVPEVCDGDAIDERAIADLYEDEALDCATEAGRLGLEGLRPHVACDPNSECTDFELLVPRCCVPSGTPCPGVDSPYQCCYAYAHQVSPQDACNTDIISGPDAVARCR
jgi:hypothetical protein